MDRWLKGDPADVCRTGSRLGMTKNGILTRTLTLNRIATRDRLDQITQMNETINGADRTTLMNGSISGHEGPTHPDHPRWTWPTDPPHRVP